MVLKSFLLVFLGGGVGSILRYGFHLYFKETTYLQTLLPNLIGCFLLGIFTQSFIAEQDSLKLMVVFGLLGGLTTFSGYVGFIGQSDFWTVDAITYFLLNNILGALAFVLALKGASLVTN
jgi:CrcB protein